MSIAIRTFSDGTDGSTGITRYWVQIDSPGSYAYGNGFVVDPDVQWPMQVDYSVGKPGEIDLLIGLTVDETDDKIFARNNLGYLVYLPVFMAHDLFGEMAEPLGIPQVSWHSGHATARNHSTASTPIFKVPHLLLDDEKIDEIFDMISCSIAPNKVSPRVMELALRRYFTSQAEPDPVDAFCDLWECLEFLSPKISGNKWAIEGRIGHYLAQHSGVKKGKIMNEWLRPLYDIRKDIVHNANENQEIIENSLHRISAIARAMIRHHLGLPYKIDPAMMPDSKPNRLWIKMNLEINPET